MKFVLIFVFLKTKSENHKINLIEVEVVCPCSFFLYLIESFNRFLPVLIKPSQRASFRLLFFWLNPQCIKLDQGTVYRHERKKPYNEK